MALRRGLFVRKDSQAGTSPADARLALAGLFQPDSQIGARPGVMPSPSTGPLVTGTAGWEYQVGPRHFLMSRGDSDGVTLAVNDGPVNVSTAPAPQTGSRYDVVWVRHRDVDSPWNDATSEPEFGVTSGTAATTPSIPLDSALPDGALRLAEVHVAAGSQSTEAAGVVISDVAPRTGMRGSRIVVRSQRERDALTPLATRDHPIEIYRQDIDRLEWNAGDGWMMQNLSTGWIDVPDPIVFYASNATNGVNIGWGPSPVFARYRIDGDMCRYELSFAIANGATGAGTGYTVFQMPVPHDWPAGHYSMQMGLAMANGAGEEITLRRLRGASARSIDQVAIAMSGEARWGVELRWGIGMSFNGVFEFPVKRS